MSELDNFRKYIKQKSGVDVFLSDDDSKTHLNGQNGLISGVYSDSDAGKTFFLLNVRDKKIIAHISGAGANEKKLALLITEIAENFFTKEDLNKTDFIKRLFRGEMTPSQIGRYTVKFSLPNYPVFVMIVKFSGGSAEDVKNLLLNYGGNSADAVIPLGEKECAVVKFCDKTSEEYRSQGEYAEYLRQTAYEETGINMSIYIGGKVDGISEVFTSYSQAVAAENFGSRSDVYGEIHSYKEYVLLGLFKEIPKNKLKEYLSVLTDEHAKEIFSDDEMLLTAEEFLNNSLNVSETARILYLHRNTLIYRLDKIEKSTGLNIRKFSDAVTFRLITYLRKLLN